MEIEEIRKAVQDLQVLGELRRELERCPNGNMKTSIQEAVDEWLDGTVGPPKSVDLVETVEVVPQSVSITKSALADNVWFVKFNNSFAMLISIEGSSPKISFDTKVSLELCEWYSPVK